MLQEYHIISSIPYYPRFHITAVGLGAYYPVDTGALLYHNLNGEFDNLKHRIKGADY
jgi:hypothetical protein